MYRWVCLFFLIAFPEIVFGQDPGFSQFFANPLYVNPAFAGTTELPRLALNYRNQWPQKGATYQTYSVSYDQLSAKLNSGIGFQMYRDHELNNVVNTSSASFLYSYHVQLADRSFMTLGLQAGVVLKQFDAGGLYFPSNIDQLSGETSGVVPVNFTDERKVFPDFAFGALGQHNEVFWGASIHHLTQPDESVTEGDQKGKIPAKVTLHAGTQTRRFHHGLLSRGFTFSPNIIYQQQGSFKQVNLGIYWIDKSFLFGGWFRNNIDVRPDAVIFLAGFAREKFRFGYSFDLTLSKLSNYSYGSHEISLTFFLGEKTGSAYHDKLLIPSI